MGTHQHARDKFTKSLPLCNRANKYNGVFSLKHPAPHNGLLTVFELLSNAAIVRVNSCQPFKALSKTRRETAVCPYAGSHKSFPPPPSGSRGLEHSNEGGSRGLLLGTLFCVPLDWATAGPRLAHSEITRKSAVILDDGFAWIATPTLYDRR